MERKEQERLEEILAMCAQYEKQIDSETKINSDVQSSPEKSKSTNATIISSSAAAKAQSNGEYYTPTSRTSPPASLPGLSTPYLSHFNDRLLIAAPSQIPGKLYW